ncbi:ABC transporter ATP-binding protein [Leptothoe sp. PORK10 BA2]|uniref:ABC transporter ATP-binding protein n=1 Tax=Leptothoe sp. PORK10 BA2 TaxID=3110254 RepID=UPI002B20A64B|nr:ABC transporter ATP-binding protein [Leptothoe sp. PORK10 BA2]MEA5466816.1 ABC transporter ATP-binding protein [Leptothoe sp. PORK10 BA2]
MRSTLPNPLPQLRRYYQEMLSLWGNTPRLIQLVWVAAPVWFLLNLGLTLVSALVPVAQLYIGKLVVDQVVLSLANGTVGFTSELWLLLVAGFGLLLLQELLTQLSSYVSRVLHDQFLLHANVQLLQQAMRLDLAHYESAEFHDVLNRAQQSGSTYPLRVVELLSQLLGSITRLVGLLTLLLRFSPGVMALLLVSVLPTFWVGIQYSQRRFWMNRRQTPSRRLADYFYKVLTDEQYVKEVRLFNLGQHMVEQYRTIRHEFNQESRRLAGQQSLAQLSIELLGGVGFYGAYGLVLWQTIGGLVTLGDLTLYAGAFQQAQTLIESILLNLATLYEYNLYVSQYFELLDISPRVVSPQYPQPFPKPMVKGLRFQDVYFTYPGSEQPTLKGINLAVAPGECIALVGLNGSGKTTLLKLLTRLYDIEQGQIVIDGVPLQQFSLGDLRSQIGILFQDFARYALDVQDNIGFGNLPRREDLELVTQAAQGAGATEVIDGLEEGYRTILGKMFSGGVDLSGGQWQKIGLARAFMSDAQILILDEPTAAVDAIAEHELFQRFRQLTRGKMTFLVSHRFSTVRMADRIVVLEQGRIVEVGTHGELMAHGGRYAEMFELQAESYT